MQLSRNNGKKGKKGKALTVGNQANPMPKSVTDNRLKQEKSFQLTRK